MSTVDDLFGSGNESTDEECESQDYSSSSSSASSSTPRRSGPYSHSENVRLIQIIWRSFYDSLVQKRAMSMLEWDRLAGIFADPESSQALSLAVGDNDPHYVSLELSKFQVRSSKSLKARWGSIRSSFEKALEVYRSRGRTGNSNFRQLSIPRVSFPLLLFLYIFFLRLLVHQV